MIGLSGLSFALAACSDNSDPVAVSGGSFAGCATRAYADIGGPFELMDQTGTLRTEADFKGSPTLVFFGFTYCPDVCPLTLRTIDLALDQLPVDIERPTTVLISVDPERDTPEAMAAYLSTDAFPENAVGLTGPESRIQEVANAFKAAYQRIEQPDTFDGYTMDHSSLVYLMDENWTLKTFFTHEASPTDMANCLTELLAPDDT